MALFDSGTQSTQLLEIRRLIEQTYGLVYDGSDSDLVTQAISDRMLTLGVSDLTSYLMLLSGPRRNSELRNLADLVTVRETRFFRGRGLFAALTRDIVPELLDRIKLSGNTGRSLRGWSAGCSTGDEAYSLAMVLLEAAEKQFPLSVRVIGTDISLSALSLAAKGVYDQRALDSVDDDLLSKDFTRVYTDCDAQTSGRSSAVRYKVTEALTSCVQFCEHNLTAFPYPTRLDGFDLILCRNVLMYFSEDTAGRVVKELAGRLNEGGYLILDPWATRPCLPESRFQSSQCSYGAVIKKAPGDSRRRQSGATLPSISDPCFSSHPAKTQVTDGDPAASDVLGCARATSALELHEASDREEAMRRARAYTDRGEWSKALPLLSELAQEASTDPEIHLLMGEVYVQIANFDAALRSFGRLAYLEPHNPIAHWRMAYVYRLMGEHSSEMSQLQNVLRCLEDPDRSYDLDISEDMLLHACTSRIEALRQLRREARRGGPLS